MSLSHQFLPFLKDTDWNLLSSNSLKEDLIFATLKTTVNVLIHFYSTFGPTLGLENRIVAFLATSHAHAAS